MIFEKIYGNEFPKTTAPVHIVTDHRKLKNVEFFKNLGNLTTNDAILYVKMNLGFPCKSNIQQEKVPFGAGWA